MAKAVTRTSMDVVAKRAFLAGNLVILFVLLWSFAARAQDTNASVDDTTATQSVVRDQLQAFQAGDVNRAYTHAAPNITGYFTDAERFGAMVKNGYAPIYKPDSFAFGRTKEISGSIYQEVIITDELGKQWQAVYTVQKQPDGSWKISGVKMEPYKGAST